jgi:hypothetical protein
MFCNYLPLARLFEPSNYFAILLLRICSLFLPDISSFFGFQNCFRIILCAYILIFFLHIRTLYYLFLLRLILSAHMRMYIFLLLLSLDGLFHSSFVFLISPKSHGCRHYSFSLLHLLKKLSYLHSYHSLHGYIIASFFFYFTYFQMFWDALCHTSTISVQTRGLQRPSPSFYCKKS